MVKHVPTRVDMVKHAPKDMVKKCNIKHGENSISKNLKFGAIEIIVV